MPAPRKKAKKPMEQRAEALFLQYKRRFIKAIGKKAMYDNQLDHVGLNLFGSRWRGVFPQDKMVCKNGFQIINVDTSDKEGSHWVAVYQTAKTVYIFDSYARSSSKLLKIISKKTNCRKKIRDADRSDAEQRDDTEICGQLTLAWLAVVRDLGIKSAMLI
jgi:hypothetical protein